MQGSDQEVVIRRLPAGDTQTGVLQNLGGRLLRIKVTPDGVVPGFTAGALVEVSCAETLYLGEVQSRLDEVVTVLVEHSIDRATLSAIQRVWYRPKSS